MVVFKYSRNQMNIAHIISGSEVFISMDPLFTDIQRVDGLSGYVYGNLLNFLDQSGKGSDGTFIDDRVDTTYSDN